MIRYLLQRPIAVLMSFAAVLVFGLAALRLLPVSLLPPVDVPRVLIRIQYPNTSAPELEQIATTPIREHLLTVSGLKDIRSQTANHSALLELFFEYGTRMDLAFIEVNEKIDRLSAQLPRDMERPVVTRVNTSDIPIVRLQVVPRDPQAYERVSDLALKTLKRRLEQTPGVSVVDLNGVRSSFFSIEPREEILAALGMEQSALAAVIQSANRELGSLSVRDGQYRYYLKVGNMLQTAADIARLPVPLPGGGSVLLEKLAEVRPIGQAPEGYHLFNGQEGIVLSIQKQPGARMNALAPRIEALVEEFRRDYPFAAFDLTQDQSFLLRASVGNLLQALGLGCLLAVLLLFLFLGNFASPALMGISIPASLVLTFVFFYLSGISLNIISLSGLALGIGMLIDNAIIVIDHITRKRRAGMTMLDSADSGTTEVISPIVTQVLTTVSVYAPLVLLSGLAGALISDQAIALSISLGVSLLVAFILAPTLYRLLLRKDVARLQEDTRFFAWILKGYHTLIHFLLKRPLFSLSVTLAIGAAGLWMAAHASVTALPQIEQTESLLRLDWNEPIDARENLRRTLALDAFLASGGAILREAEAGIPQFLQQQEEPSMTRLSMYYACTTGRNKRQLDDQVQQWLSTEYPTAQVEVGDAPNAFTQLFAREGPVLEARFQPPGAGFTPEQAGQLQALLGKLSNTGWRPGPGLQPETIIELLPREALMQQYGISQAALQARLFELFGQGAISSIKRFGEVRTIRFQDTPAALDVRLEAPIVGSNSQSYPLRTFLETRFAEQEKFITAGKTGEYKSVYWAEMPGTGVSELMAQLNALAAREQFTVEFKGAWLDNQANARQLFQIFLLSLLLLYFIMAVQFENLLHPLLVIGTLPLGIFGAMVLLNLHHAPIDVMAAIGFIVVLGIISDDPILKIHTINRLRREYAVQGIPAQEALQRAIHEAGEICLKPVLMTSLTTVLALLPVLFTPGIGAELQRTLVLVVCGGLTLGTFFTLWFVPVAYAVLHRGVGKKSTPSA